MLLDQANLSMRISKRKQEEEIKRLKNAQPGEVLFMNVPLSSQNDVSETLLFESKVKFKRIETSYMVRFCRV